MDICFVAGPHTDNFIAKASKSVDTFSYAGYPTISELVHQAPLTRSTYNRVVVFDSVNNTLNDFMALSNYVETQSSGTEVVFLAREDERVELFTSGMSSPMTVAILLESGMTAAILKSVLSESISDLKARYSPVDDSIGVLQSQRIDSDRQVDVNQDLSSMLDLSSMGASHADTGWLTGEDNPIDSIFPPLTVSDWPDSIPEFPGYDINDKSTYPLMPIPSRVLVSFSVNEELAYSYAAQHAKFLSDKGCSVLFFDLPGGKPGLKNLISNPDAFKAFGANISDSLYYSEGTLYIATNGISKPVSQEDAQEIVQQVELFDYTVVPCTPATIGFIETICETYDSVSVVWLIKGTPDGLSSTLNTLANRDNISDGVSKCLSRTCWVHPGHPNKQFHDMIETISHKFVWGRDSFSKQFGPLVHAR